MPKIVLRLEGKALSDEDLHALRVILADALGEYRFARGPTPEEYVNRRYAGQYVPFRQAQVKAVRRNLRLARRLHNPALTLTQED